MTDDLSASLQTVLVQASQATYLNNSLIPTTPVLNVPDGTQLATAQNAHREVKNGTNHFC